MSKGKVYRLGQAVKQKRRLFAKAFMPALVIALGVAGVFQMATAFGSANITVTTDKPDYAPMEVVTITGNNFEPGKTYTLQVASSDMPPVALTTDVTADSSGQFVYKYQLDGTYRPNYAIYVKDGSQIVASTTFTDANPATDISQCQNGGIGDPLQPCSETPPNNAASGYGYEGNANANGGNSHWFEGDFVPLRIVATNFVAGPGNIQFSIDITKGGKHAYDYVGSFDATESTGATAGSHANHNNPCGDVISGCDPTAPDSSGGVPGATLNPFPVACGSNSFVGSQIAGSIKAWGTSGPLAVTYVTQNVGSSDCTTTIQVAWGATQASFGGKIVIAYGAHIAKQSDWGAGNSAINISGSPYHSSLVSRTTGGDTKGIGQQDAKLAASAVVVPQNATLTLIKTVTNDNGGTAQPADWTLSASGPTPISGASGSGTVTNAAVTQGSYTLSESGGPANYTAGTYSCVKNGGGAVVSNSITLAANDVATCTINNNDNPPALHLRKTVTNNNGGTAANTDWTLTATGTGGSPTNLSGTTPVDSTASFKADTYALGESGPANYTGGAWNCGGATMPDTTYVTVPFGGNVTCTINNDDNAAHLIVIKHVVNDNGGSAVAGSFSTTISGVATAAPTAAGVESPGVNNVLTSVGAYSVDEGAHTGYTKTLSADCSGTIALGQTKTCTITNDDQQAFIIVNKTVVNNNGGSAVANDFNLTVDGNAVLDEVAYAVNPGTHTAGETNLPGYTAGAWGGDCNVNASVTVALGETKTCTITNDDQAAHLIVIKEVVNDNGGTKVAGDFSGTISGVTVTGGGTWTGTVTPGVNKTLTSVGSYTVAETADADYTTTYSADCTGSIALGQTKTCTVTNNDKAAHLIVIKHVINNNGGSAAAGNFTTTITGVTTATPSAAGVESPGVDNVLTTVGSYGVDEGAHAGYTKTLSADCSGTIALGQTKTCTITNDDQQAFVIVDKTVVNNNGGSAVANDFHLTVDGNAVSDAVAYAVNPGTHTAGETQLPGYTAGAWGGDCNVNASVTVALGETKTCTITNDDQQAYITVVKVVTNDNGGSAQPNDFKLTLAGQSVSSGVQVPVNPGTYTAAETQVAGYSFDGFSGDCDSNGDTTVALGESKACTLTNNDQAAHLIVIKHVVNDNGGTKAAGDFTTTISNVTTAVPTAAGVESPGVNNTLTSVGAYSVDEGAHVGYAKTLSTDCSGTIALGQTKTCTITNDDIAPQLTVIKHVVNDNGGTAVASAFTMNVTATNPSDDSFPGAEDPGTTITLNAGSYSVDENAFTGYAKTLSADCSGTVALDEHKTCTITNDDIAPKLTLVKVVTNDNGGNKQVSDFPLFVNGNLVTSGTANTLSANTLYTATETNSPGYEPSAWTGDCAANGTITLAPGDDKTCTITNDDVAPTIKLIKVVTNNNGGTAGVNDFGLTIGGAATTSGAAKSVMANTPIALNEAGLAGYSFVSLTGDAKCPDVLGGTVTLDPGENITCTITNDDIPAHLIVIKHVVNDNGGIKVAGDFTLTINSVTASGGNSVTGTEAPGVDKTLTTVGSYNVTEGAVSGYAASFSTDCTGSIALGETKTCTVTNDDQAAHLIVIKHVINDNGGTALAAAFSTTITGVSTATPTAPGVESPGVNNTLTSVGAYDVDEGAHTGYTKIRTASCTGTIALGETKICTITNDDIAPQLLVIKHVINDDGDVAVASDFTMQVTGTNVSSPSFPGNELGIFVTLNAGAYSADEAANNGYIKTLGLNCSGTIAVGEVKTCVITNNDIPHATRTLGFWQTHTTYTSGVFAGFSGTLTIGTKNIDTTNKLFAGFYASISKDSNGAKRSQLDQARMQLLQQWLAAKLNCKAFGCSAATQTLLANAAAAWSGTDRNLILSYASQLDAYNNSNDALPISGQGKATPGTSQTLAAFQLGFWNVLP